MKTTILIFAILIVVSCSKSEAPTADLNGTIWSQIDTPYSHTTFSYTFLKDTWTLAADNPKVASPETGTYLYTPPNLNLYSYGDTQHFRIAGKLLIRPRGSGVDTFYEQ